MTILAATLVFAAEPPPVLKVGIIGLDTSHATAFTNLLHGPKAKGDLADFRVVAAFPGGSDDIPSSKNRVPTYTAELRDKHKVEIVSTIPELLAKVDVVLLESLDGRPKLEQARPIFAAKKPVFIDKPAGASLADVIALYRLAAKSGTPMFSSSGLRFAPGIAATRSEKSKFGKPLGCVAYSPCSLDPHHPDFYWYGIHGVEILYTVMGPGCQTVTRSTTTGADSATGVWKDGRIGTFVGNRHGKPDYGAVVFGEKANGPTGGFGGYDPLVVEICKFFRSGKPPVSPEETIELYAFMSAADESKKRGGVPIPIAEVIAVAEKEADRLLVPNSTEKQP
jgi:predicted dehydrogenase